MYLLVSITLILIGVIAAQALKIPDNDGFTDFLAAIGSLMAGGGTVGLMFIALQAKDEWKKQVEYKEKRDVILRIVSAYHRWQTYCFRASLMLDDIYEEFESKNNKDPNLPTLNSIEDIFNGLNDSGHELKISISDSRLHSIPFSPNWELEIFIKSRYLTSWVEDVFKGVKANDFKYIEKSINESISIPKGLQVKSFKGWHHAFETMDKNIDGLAAELKK